MKQTYLLGYDIGSSSVKASLVDVATGNIVASDFFPKSEMEITALHAGWAEQHPDMWWENLLAAHNSVMRTAGIDPGSVAATGISYQMHGLVAVDREQRPLRPSIIWCDSRAVQYGERAFEALGEKWSLEHLLNSPGNFTAAKLAWVRDNEPDLYARIDKIMLPGDYIAMRLTGRATTTVGGLSEGIFWDFKEGKLSEDVLRQFGFDKSLIPDLVPTFGIQGELSSEAAQMLGLKKGTPVTYRAGDQPNNALSLNVFEPGEIASTAGTSGVVCGVLGKVGYDPLSRVNTFAHVNHTPENTRLCVLLCINGAGILNSWMKRNVAPAGAGYDEMNEMAARSPIGARGVSVVPFGNGAERMVQNRETGCSVHGINFNIHDRNDLLRAAQEGIIFAFNYGMDVMREMGIRIEVIRAGMANMFLSPLFRQGLATISGARIELYDTDGAAGAARGAGIGAGIYASPAEAFATLRRVATVEPVAAEKAPYTEAYRRWEAKM